MTTPIGESLTDRLKTLVHGALEVHSQGDQITWDLGSGMGPNNQLFHFLTLIAPSPILGEAIQAGAMIVNGRDVTEEQIAQVVKVALENIRNERTKKLGLELPSQTNVPVDVITGLPK
jgi:hypothetical protein